MDIFIANFLIGNGIYLLTQPFVAPHVRSEKGWGGGPWKSSRYTKNSRYSSLFTLFFKTILGNFQFLIVLNVYKYGIN